VSLAVVVAQGLSLLFLRRDQVSRRGLLLAAGVVAVGLLPLGALLLRYGAGSTTWIPPTSFDEFVETLESLAGGTRWLLAVTGVACAVALVAAVRTWTSSGRGPGSWRYGLLVCWLVVPFVLVTLVSLRRHVFLVRYFVGVLPAVVILAAVGIVAMKPRWFAALFLAGLVALNVAVLADWLSSDVRTANTGVAREDWRGAVHHVVRSAGTDDAVVFQFGHLELVWSYYARGHDTPRLVSDPTWDRFDESRVASIPPGHPHVWVLVSHVDPARQRLVRDLFARRYDLGATREFDGDIDVLRYDARD
jgi:hypothetical protein